MNVNVAPAAECEELWAVSRGDGSPQTDPCLDQETLGGVRFSRSYGHFMSTMSWSTCRHEVTR